VRKQGLQHFYNGHPEQIVYGKEVGFLTPRDPKFVATAQTMAIVKFLKKKHLAGEEVLKVDNETLNRGMQDQLVEAGLAKREFSKPAFKWRAHVPAKEARRLKKQEKEQEIE